MAKTRGKKSALYGQLTDNSGNAVLAPFAAQPLELRNKAGYEPERLDDLLESLIQNAEMGSAVLLTYIPLLKQLMDRLQAEFGTMLANMPTARAITDGEVSAPKVSDQVQVLLKAGEDITRFLERFNKMVMQSARATDDASRLRTFLATGDEDREGLESLGENQLRRIVMEAASGWIKNGDEA